MGRVEQVGLDAQVVVQELDGTRGVGGDPADPGGGVDDDRGPRLVQEAGGRGRVAQVDLCRAHPEDVGEALGPQVAHHRGPDEPRRPGDEHAGVAGQRPAELQAGKRVSRGVLREGVRVKAARD